jgi:hypothetical protein
MRRGYGRELAIGDFMNVGRIKISGPGFRRPPSRMMQLFHLAVNPLLLNLLRKKSVSGSLQAGAFGDTMYIQSIDDRWNDRMVRIHRAVRGDLGRKR